MIHGSLCAERFGFFVKLVQNGCSLLGALCKHGKRCNFRKRELAREERNAHPTDIGYVVEDCFSNVCGSNKAACRIYRNVYLAVGSFQSLCSKFLIISCLFGLSRIMDGE